MLDITKPFTVTITGQDGVKTVSNNPKDYGNPIKIEFHQDETNWHEILMPVESLYERVKANPNLGK